jgi:transposase-like protein
MTIVPIGKVILQEPNGEESSYQRQMDQGIQEVVGIVVGQSIEVLLQRELDRQLQRKRHQRREQMWGELHSPMQCGKCGSHKRNDYRRNGSYARGLDTRYGHVSFRMPQVECQCGGSVQVQYPMLKRRQRIWEDVRVVIRQQAGLKLPLRAIKAELDARLGGSVGLRTINACIRATAVGEAVERRLALQETPPVMIVDGIWVTVMYATGKQCKDRMGRMRAEKRGQRRVVLVAQGVWPTSGRREVLGWVIAQSEDQDAWGELMALLLQKGLQIEQVQLVIGDGSPGFEALRRKEFAQTPFQRCIFHKLQNILRALKVPANLDHLSARAYKKAILQQAERIWQAHTAPAARQAQQAFCDRWRVEQPVVVETVCRDFELTLTFYAVHADALARGEAWPLQLLRTSSHLERENREFRSLFHHRLLFHSQQGLTAALLLQTLIRRSTVRSVPDLPTFTRVLDDFLNLAARFLT